MRPPAAARGALRRPLPRSVARHPPAPRRGLSASAAPRERTLLLSRDDATGIVTVSPNRPEKRNAINRAMWDEVRFV